MRTVTRSALPACCLLAAGMCTSLLQAADITGTIVGTVSDPSAAKVVGAQVTIESVDRNRAERTLSTDSGGNFAAALLPIGKYTISVEAKGFRKATLTGIVLNVNDKLTFPISLQIGDVNQVVTVQESPLAIQLQSAEQSTTITGRQVTGLTLNNRNYEQLLTLMPGVSSSASDQIYVGVSNPSGQSNQVNFSINGSRPTQNNWTVDGADNVDRGANLTLLNYPSVDAIQEFKVLRSDYSAEFGRAGGGQINVVTKSGTSQFHGDAYEFVRNNAFAANNFLNNSHGVKEPPLRYNDFGWTLGGPIFIPKVYNRDKNKTFFFVSEEFRRVITYTSSTATLPTAQMEQGIFAHPICLSYTGNTCAQTGTRVTNVDPVAQEYLKDIFSRVPTSTASNFSSVTPIRNIYNFEQELYKLDHVFSPKLQVSVRYLRDQIPTVEPGGLFTGLAVPGVAVTSTNSPGRSWVGRATSSITPTLVNEAGFAYSFGAVVSVPTGFNTTAQSPDIKVPLPFPVTLGRVPNLTFNGTALVSGYGPYNDYNRNYNGYDNMSAILGRHNLKYGFSYNYYQKTENAANANQGSFAFSPPSGVVPAGTSAFEQAWADFLTGHVSTFTQASKDITPDIRAQQWELYVQDDWRITPTFTLNLGLRYSMFRNPIDNNNQLSTFDPALWYRSQAPTVTAAGNIVPGTGNTLNGIIIGGQNSPYGQKVSSQATLDFAPRFGFAWDPTGSGRTAIRGGYGIFYDATAYGFYELNIFNNLPFVNSLTVLNTSLSNPLAGTVSVSATPPSARATSPNYVPPYTQQSSFGIQRQLSSSAMLDVSYVGSKSTHLIGIVDLNEVYPGLAFSSGIIPAGTVVTSATTPRLNAIRPYPGYTAVNMVAPWFNANYNSLQVYAKKQFGGDSEASVSYTYSKNLTDNQSDNSTAPQNSYNFAAEYGRAQQDRRHVFSANYVYGLPFFRQQKGVVGKVLGGWDISGIVQAASGLPFTVTTSGVDPGGLGFLGASAAGPRPDMFCSNPNGGGNAPHTLATWFNTLCFGNVPAGVNRPGNAGRGVINGPGFQRWDVSLFKNFLFHERYQFQLRGDAFNVFNHTNPLTVTTSFTSAQFGQITAFRDPRIIQIAAKFNF